MGRAHGCKRHDAWPPGTGRGSPSGPGCRIASPGRRSSHRPPLQSAAPGAGPTVSPDGEVFAYSRVARRIGLLGSWKSRFPSTDASYSSLDTVTWSTARALRRRGAEVVVAGAEVAAGGDG